MNNKESSRAFWSILERYTTFASNPRLNMGSSTVYDIAKRNGLERPSNKDGRQLKIPEVIKRNIIQNTISGKCDTAVKAAGMLSHVFNIDVSAQTGRYVSK